MERSLLMSAKKKDRPWDGRSRVSTKQYKENYNEIFKKEKNLRIENTMRSFSKRIEEKTLSLKI